MMRSFFLLLCKCLSLSLLSQAVLADDITVKLAGDSVRVGSTSIKLVDASSGLTSDTRKVWVEKGRAGVEDVNNFTKNNRESVKANYYQSDSLQAVDSKIDRLRALNLLASSDAILVGPPAASYSSKRTNTWSYFRGMNGYRDFKSQNKSRKPIVFAPLQDGMLHAFEKITQQDGRVGLQELWAFMPDKNVITTTPFALHSPQVEDIYFNGQWYTVLVCGIEGGYFALDVTNPIAPRVLYQSDLISFSMQPVFAYLPESVSYRWVWLVVDTNKSIRTVDAVTGLPLGNNLNNPLVGNPDKPGKSVTRLTRVTPDQFSNASFVGSVIYFLDEDARVWRVHLTGNPSQKGQLYSETFSGIVSSSTNNKISAIKVSNFVNDDLSLLFEANSGSRLMFAKLKDFPGFGTLSSPVNVSGLAQGKCAATDESNWYVDVANIPDSSGTQLGSGWAIKDFILFQKKVYLELKNNSKYRIAVVDLCGKSMVSTREYTSDEPMFYYNGVLYKKDGSVTLSIPDYCADLKSFIFNPRSNIKFKTRVH